MKGSVIEPKKQKLEVVSVNSNDCYNKLYSANNADILSDIYEYSLTFTSYSLSGCLPPFLSEFYKPKHLDLPYYKLLHLCEEVYMSIN